MPRKKLYITHEFPYHITARSNNREWFYLPTDQCWEIFTSQLTLANLKFRFQIHGFALMSNHYHLVGTASINHPLPKVMEWYQRSVNRIVNDKAGRINHLFGGPYRASLVTDPYYYFQALKYVYRNPVTAGICKTVEAYPYSSLSDHRIPLTTPLGGFADLIPRKNQDLLDHFNQGYAEKEKELIDLAIRKREFKFPNRAPRQMKDQMSVLCGQSQKGSAYLLDLKSLEL